MCGSVQKLHFFERRFLTSFGRLSLRFLEISLFWRPPAYVGDLELTGTKKGFPIVLNCPSNQKKIMLKEGRVDGSRNASLLS